MLATSDPPHGAALVLVLEPARPAKHRRGRRRRASPALEARGGRGLATVPISHRSPARKIPGGDPVRRPGQTRRRRTMQPMRCSRIGLSIAVRSVMPRSEHTGSSDEAQLLTASTSARPVPPPRWAGPPRGPRAGRSARVDQTAPGGHPDPVPVRNGNERMRERSFSAIWWTSTGDAAVRSPVGFRLGWW